MGELEDGLNAFRAELERESVAAASIDELVEHLREIIDARIAAGDDVTTAIRMARDRLGDAKSLARECARVRSTFGPKPPRTVAWSAAALVVLWFALWSTLEPNLLVGRFTVVLSVVLVALVLRSPQALGFVLGFAASTLLVYAELALQLTADDLATVTLLLIVAVTAAIVTLLATGLRHTAASMALVALAWTLSSVVLRYSTWTYRDLRVDLVAPVALGIAILLVSLRVRGAALACLVCGLILLPDLRFLWTTSPYANDLSSPGRILDVVHVVGGVVTPFIAAIAMRRQSRPFAEAFRRKGPTAA